MPRVNVKEETRLFGERVKNGEYGNERSRNTEVNYAQEKEPRDTQAVKDYTETESFKYIVNMR